MLQGNTLGKAHSVSEGFTGQHSDLLWLTLWLFVVAHWPSSEELQWSYRHQKLLRSCAERCSWDERRNSCPFLDQARVVFETAHVPSTFAQSTATYTSDRASSHMAAEQRKVIICLQVSMSWVRISSILSCLFTLVLTSQNTQTFLSISWAHNTSLGYVLEKRKIILQWAQVKCFQGEAFIDFFLKNGHYGLCSKANYKQQNWPSPARKIGISLWVKVARAGGEDWKLVSFTDLDAQDLKQILPWWTTRCRIPPRQGFLVLEFLIP